MGWPGVPLAAVCAIALLTVMPDIIKKAGTIAPAVMMPIRSIASLLPCAVTGRFGQTGMTLRWPNCGFFRAKRGENRPLLTIPSRALSFDGTSQRGSERGMIDLKTEQHSPSLPSATVKLMRSMSSSAMQLRDALRRFVVRRACGGDDRARPDVFGRRRLAAGERGWRRLCSQAFAGIHPAFRRDVFHPQAAGRGDQWPRYRRRRGARLLHRPADYGGRRRPHRRDRASGRRAVPGTGVRGRSLRCAGRHFPEFMFGGATYEADAALQRGWVDEVVAADALLPRAIAAAQNWDDCRQRRLPRPKSSYARRSANAWSGTAKLPISSRPTSGLRPRRCATSAIT